MLRRLRLKLSPKISPIKGPEHSSWQKWIKTPLNEFIVIEKIPVEISEQISFNKKFIPPLHIKINYSFPSTFLLPEFETKSFKKPKTNPVFFTIKKGEVRQSLFSKGSRLHKPELKKITLMEPGISITEIESELKAGLLKSFNFTVSNPEILNKLENLIAEIYQVNFTSFDFENTYDHLPSVKSFKVEAINKKVRIFKSKIDELPNVKPKVFSAKNIQLNKHLHLLNYSISEIPGVEIQAIDFSHLNFEEIIPDFSISDLKTDFTTDITDIFSDESLPPYLYSILYEKGCELSAEEEKEILKPLKSYHKAGAKFLASNHSAVLCEEIGMDIILQAVHALKILFRRKEVRSILVLTDVTNIGNDRVGYYKHQNYGWVNILREYLYNYPAAIFRNYDELDKDKFKVPVKLILSENFKEIFSDSDKISSILKTTDCLVIDTSKLEDYNLEDFDFPNLKYKWRISYKDIKSVSVQNGFLYQALKKINFHDDIPQISHEDLWINLDENQKLEYEEIFQSGRSDLKRMFNEGNPLFYKANIFTLLHKLNQVCNFSSSSEENPKINLMLEQIDELISNGSKVLILSQYDRQGLKRIENVLKKNTIRSYLYEAVRSDRPAENQFSKNVRESKADVILSSSKLPTIYFKPSDIQYVIHFDHLWNPVNQWYTDEMLRYDALLNFGNVHIISYLTRNSIFEDIKKYMFNRTILDKNLFDNLSAEKISSLISIEDWTFIFGIGNFNCDQEFEAQQLFNLSIVESYSFEIYLAKIESVLTFLGFREIQSQEIEFGREVNLYSSIIRNTRTINLQAKFIYADYFDYTEVNDFYLSQNKFSLTEKIIFFSNAKIEGKENIISADNFSFIDSEKLCDILQMINLI
jgi:hypothetical protein